MNQLRIIKTSKDYNAALARLEKVFDAKPGTDEGSEVELLALLIEDYERRNYPIEAPSPIEAIKFRMEQMNLKQADLVKYMGSESRVSEILNGKRSLTIDMIIALNKGLDIPLESLIRDKSKTRNKRRYSSSRRNISMAEEPNVAYNKLKHKRRIDKNYVHLNYLRQQKKQLCSGNSPF